jgi:nicotinamidase-related amidase
MAKKDFHLLIIDPQNDFCDLPADYLPADPLNQGFVINPQLAVGGAHNDMLRLAEFINRGQRGLNDISVTLDSHHRVGIERPAMWMQADGSPVNPFTQITAADVRAGKYLPRNPNATKRVLAYLDALEAGGRYVHMVWTPHCEIGTWGHNVHADVRAAYNAWEERELGVVNKVTKGSNPWTEHYSAVMAEVPDANDPTTQLNRCLINVLASADLVLISGEAGSHCVKATTEHIADNFGADSLSKLVILKDTISPVGGFEKQYEDFLRDMSARGLQVSTTADMLPELVANSHK